MIYLSHYGLRALPFSLSPNPEFFYPSVAHKAALDHLVYGLTQDLGFILLTGEIGSGKTTLLRHLHSLLGQDTEVAQVFNTNVSPHELLKLVLQEFELDAKGDKADLLDELNSFLIARFAEGKRSVLIIDEAQNLSVGALEEVRMLSNLQTETTPLLQIVLVGQPELADRMRAKELRQLAQRVTVSYHLPPLGAQETGEYIAHRMRIAECPRENLFDQAAVELVHVESEGIPRIINNLCDAALLAGFADNKDFIDAAIVREVVQERRSSGCPVGRVLGGARSVMVPGNDSWGAAPSALPESTQSVSPPASAATLPPQPALATPDTVVQPQEQQSAAPSPFTAPLESAPPAASPFAEPQPAPVADIPVAEPPVPAPPAVSPSSTEAPQAVHSEAVAQGPRVAEGEQATSSSPPPQPTAGPVQEAPQPELPVAPQSSSSKQPPEPAPGGQRSTQPASTVSSGGDLPGSKPKGTGRLAGAMGAWVQQVLARLRKRLRFL